MKYLLVWCNVIARECEANREPIGMVDSLADYGEYLYNESRGESGYEVYELNMSNLFVKMTDEEVLEQIRKEQKGE